MAAGAAQHGDRLAFAGLPQGVDGAHDLLAFAADIRGEADGYLAVVGVVGGREGWDGDLSRGELQRDSDVVCQGENLAVVSKRGVQRQRRHRRGGGKPLLEICEGLGACAAPAVDRLVRVPHRRDGVIGAEQAQQELKLRHGGVLEFVEEHKPVALAHDALDVGNLGDSCGDGGLVRELDDAEILLAFVVFRDEIDQ